VLDIPKCYHATDLDFNFQEFRLSKGLDTIVLSFGLSTLVHGVMITESNQNKINPIHHIFLNANLKCMLNDPKNKKC
jgi:hypothetical protein